MFNNRVSEFNRECLYIYFIMSFCWCSCACMALAKSHVRYYKTKSIKHTKRYHKSSRLKPQVSLLKPKDKQIEIKNQEEALKLAQNQKKLNLAYELYDSALNYSLNNNFAAAIENLNKAQAILNDCNSQGMVLSNYLNSDLANFYRRSQNPEMARNITDKNLSSDNYFSSEDYINYIYLLLELNKTDEAMNDANLAHTKFPDNLTIKLLFDKIKH